MKLPSEYDPEIRADEPKYSMPDGSYPINTCTDVKNAANLAHHSKKYTFQQVKAMVLKAKAGLGCPDSVLPDTWDENAAPKLGEQRAAWDPDADGDDDSSPEGDTDHSHWDAEGNPIMEQWLADGASPPGSVPDVDDEDEVSSGIATSIGYGPQVVGTGMASAAPRDNLVRAMPSGFEMRASDPTLGPTEFFMTFSKFNQWYPVSSVWEGEFMERVMPGAFADTIKNDRAQMRVLYDHGMDPSIGNKPIGPIRTYEERADGPYVDGPFLDTAYNRDDVIPMLTGRLLDGSTVGSQLGASFRFQVVDDSWNMKPKPSKWNPAGLPQRSIIKTKTFEAGPVTFPASPSAEAAGRSLSDEWIARLIGDTRFQQDFADRVGAKVAERILASIPAEKRQEIIHQTRRGLQDKLRRQARALLVLAG